MDLAQAALAVNPKDVDSLSRMALFYARLGKKQEAEAEIRKARQLAPANRQVLWNSALIYALAGQREPALKSLQAALQAGPPLAEVQREPAFAGLRKDPRYAKLVPAE